jgi:hypothetical protein
LSQGFTLWNATGHGSLNFRALVEEPDAKGHVRGIFAGGTTAFTTNALGGLKAWKVKTGRPAETETAPQQKMMITRKDDESKPRGQAQSSYKKHPNPGGGVHRGGVQLGASAAASAGKMSLASEELSLWDWDEELPRDSGYMEEWSGRVPAAAAGSAVAAAAPPVVQQRRVQQRPAASLRVHSEDINSLPIKDLDELISFYLG